MKTVIVCSNVCWSIFNFRRNLLCKLLQKGYRVVVVAQEDEYTERLKAMGCEYRPLYISASGKNPFQDVFTILSLVRTFRLIKPSYILNFSPKVNIYSSIASWFIRCKVINNIAGLGVVFIGNGIVSKIVKLLYRISQQRADLILFQNEDDRKVFLDSNICSIEKTDMLPGSGVDLERFKPSQSGIDKGGSLHFLFTSRMLYDKGVLLYVQAARQLKLKYGAKVVFQLLGFIDSDNPSAVSQKVMHEWIEEGMIEYLGVSDKVEEVVSKVDCVVLPSYYREGVPRSLLEAAALAKPLITTNSVGCRDAVDDGLNGFICEPRSLKDLVNKIEQFIELTSSERLTMGLNSRAKVEKCFDENLVISKYLNVIE